VGLTGLVAPAAPSEHGANEGVYVKKLVLAPPKEARIVNVEPVAEVS
jgi:hypothetical protein